MTAPSTRGPDIPTLIATGLVAYVIVNVVHEGLGHGGVCLAVGGRPIAISSAWWDGSYQGVSEWGRRAVRAGGTLANLALGAACVEGLLGREDEIARVALARRLCWWPYAVGGIAFTLAGSMNPMGSKFAITSALATFGGKVFLALLPKWVKPSASSSEPSIALGRSPPWIITGVVAAAHTPGISETRPRRTSPSRAGRRERPTPPSHGRVRPATGRVGPAGWTCVAM